MKTESCVSDLYQSCHVLFGQEFDASANFLRCLQLPGLKAVYRKKALETHPDRAIALNCRPVVLEEEFKKVSAAYHHLQDYLENLPRPMSMDDRFTNIQKGYPERKMKAGVKTRGNSTDPSEDGVKQHFFKGSAPQRSLLLGQFIYYEGYISYRQLIDAIVWQKFQRPLIGVIAMRGEWLYGDDVHKILTQRLWGEKFGESALRGGYLTVDELRIILRRQRILQPRIGKYFVEKKILSFSHIESILQALRLHNRQYASL